MASPIRERISKKSVPMYRRIADTLAQQVQSGKLSPGDPVPSERELAASFTVSLMTARHALQVLTTEGILSRRPNIGTFVAPPRIHFNRLTSFTEEMIARRLVPESRVLDVKTAFKNEEVTSRLSLPPSTPLIRVERLRMTAEDPFALEICYLPASKFGEITRENLEQKSLFSVLSDRYGVVIRYADEEIDATSADRRTSRQLQVPVGAPILRIRQILYDGPTPAVYSAALYRSDRHSLLIRRFR